MSNELQDAIISRGELFVKQRKEFGEIIVGYEAKNNYLILDENQKELGLFIETKSGFWAWILRFFLRSHRSLFVDVLTMDLKLLFKIERPFFFFFSDLKLFSNGKVIGTVNRRFGILYKKYDLRDHQGNTFATIKSPLWRLWTFPVFDARTGEQCASVSKKWGGVLREVFTDADVFRVEFGKHPWSAAQRAIIFAASISIDFDFFEDNANKGGMLGFGD